MSTGHCQKTHNISALFRANLTKIRRSVSLFSRFLATFPRMKTAHLANQRKVGRSIKYGSNGLFRS